MNGPSPIILSLLMIAAFALTLGAVHLIRKGEERGKGWLMLAAAAVALVNVLIWAS